MIYAVFSVLLTTAQAENTQKIKLNMYKWRIPVIGNPLFVCIITYPVKCAHRAILHGQ